MHIAHSTAQQRASHGAIAAAAVATAAQGAATAATASVLSRQRARPEVAPATCDTCPCSPEQCAMRRARGRAPPPLVYAFAVAAVVLGVGLVGAAASTTAAASTASMAPVEPPTSTRDPELADRGLKKFGDRCNSTQECGFSGSECNSAKKQCLCVAELPITNHIDKCGKESTINESCFFNAQCEATTDRTECRDGRCGCRFELTPSFHSDGTVECIDQ